MIIHVDLFAVHAVQKVLLLGLQAFFGILRDKLEGRVGLWHKAGHADGHLHAFALEAVRVCIIQINNLLGGVCNALNVLQRFGGRPIIKYSFTEVYPP